ncbi:hypothetical protein DRO38_07935 [Candidatus Bathyarchaeota archaeon]|nr:MAG: hypothetical protein DRO38_07935 [Candidatus Bathyarchaeota archaeon]
MDNEKKIGIPGLAIFCVGLGLLFFTFYLAYQLFQDPTVLTFVKTSPGGRGDILQPVIHQHSISCNISEIQLHHPYRLLFADNP